MERIRIDDFVDFKFISGLEYNEKGTYACFVVYQGDVQDNDYKSNLWLYDAGNDQCRQLTGHNEDHSFIWLNDNEHLIFRSTRDQKAIDRKKQGEILTVFYRINVHGGEGEKFFEVPLVVGQIEQIDATNFLLLGTYNPKNPNLLGMDDRTKDEILKHGKEEKDYEVLEEIPFWGNGLGFTSGNRRRLYLYNVESCILTGLTEKSLDIDSFDYSRDNGQVVFIGQKFQGKREVNNAIYLMDYDSKAVRKLNTTTNFRYYQAKFVGDNLLFVLGTDGARYGLNENPRFYVLDINRGKKTNITPNLDMSIGNTIGSDCRYGGSPGIKKVGNYLYFVTTEGTSANLNRIDTWGEITKVTHLMGSVDDFAINGQHVLIVHLKPDKLQELYKLGAEGIKQLTDFNEWFTSKRKILQLNPCNYRVSDDIEVEGWVIPPTDFNDSKKYPAILNIHGGPKTAYGQVYYHEMQYWANQGYFVMFCNPRGSDGKGNSFADIRQKYGTIDYDDLMGFVDTVLKSYPNIDPRRLGVTGGSYGGFMTNWIIGHTHRFKAAVSQRSISNWISMGYTTDIGYYFTNDQIGSDPWRDMDKLWNASPLRYADKVRTPTLFIHSEQDYRCWLAEGLQMFTALRYHGVESRLCLFREENHELSRSGKPKHRIRRLQEITKWFEHYLK